MTLPTGSIGMWDVNLELGRPGGQNIDLNDSAVRALSGQPSGAVDMNSMRGKSAYTPMTVNATNGDSGYYSDNSGVAYSYPSVSVSGGTGGYTYSWSFTSNPNACNLANANSAQCTVSKGYTRYSNGSYSATLQCVVQDNTGHSVTASNIYSNSSWEYS